MQDLQTGCQCSKDFQSSPTPGWVGLLTWRITLSASSAPGGSGHARITSSSSLRMGRLWQGRGGEPQAARGDRGACSTGRPQGTQVAFHSWPWMRMSSDCTMQPWQPLLPRSVPVIQAAQTERDRAPILRGRVGGAPLVRQHSCHACVRVDCVHCLRSRTCTHAMAKNCKPGAVGT